MPIERTSGYEKVICCIVVIDLRRTDYCDTGICRDNLQERCSYQGTLRIAKTSTLGFSYPVLSAAGFSMSGSSSTTWYARKCYSGSVTINLR